MTKTTTNLEDLKTRLQSIAQFAGKTVHVLSEDDFLTKLKGVPTEAVAILYEGSRSIDKAQGSTHRAGISGEMTVSLLLVLDGKTMFGADLRGTALELLDLIRKQLLDTVAPSGHFWKFIAEAPAVEKDGKVV